MSWFGIFSTKASTEIGVHILQTPTFPSVKLPFYYSEYSITCQLKSEKTPLIL